MISIGFFIKKMKKDIFKILKRVLISFSSLSVFCCKEYCKYDKKIIHSTNAVEDSTVKTLYQLFFKKKC